METVEVVQMRLAPEEMVEVEVDADRVEAWRGGGRRLVSMLRGCFSVMLFGPGLILAGG